MQYTVCRMRCAVPVDHVGGARARWSTVGSIVNDEESVEIAFPSGTHAVDSFWRGSSRRSVRWSNSVPPD